MTDLKTLDQLKSESMTSDRLRSILLAIFSMIALALSAVGIYGVVSYSVAQRTNEIGIRAALGATGGNLVGLAMRGGMWMMFAGLAIGFAGSLAFARALSSQLYNRGAWDAPPWPASLAYSQSSRSSPAISPLAGPRALIR